MGMKARFTQSDIQKMFAIRIERIEKAIIDRLSLIGEEYVNAARKKAPDSYDVVVNGKKTAMHKAGPRMNFTTADTEGFIDQTGNLRSSIGYVVLKNGVVKAGSAFDEIKDGSEGSTKGKERIKKLKAKYKTGYVLIVTAGMGYAAAVEAKGYDVLTGSSFEAKAQLEKAKINFKKTAKNR